jgi:nuclear pore complex protein Nup160
LQFCRFAGNDPFSSYIQGRAFLAANDALTASMLFKKAAFGIGKFRDFSPAVQALTNV